MTKIQIGKGISGRVYSVGNGTVIKEFFNRRDFQRELQAYRSIPKHERLCEMIDWNYWKMTITMKRYTTTLSKFRVSRFNSKDTIRLVTDIIEGIRHIHENGFVHADLKPENVFMTSLDPHEARAVIGDLGAATPSEEFPILRGGNYRHSSPEHYAKDPSTGFKSDVWGIGVMIYKFLTGEFLHDDKTTTLAKQFFKIGKLPSLTPSDVSSEDLSLFFIYHMYCRKNLDHRLSLI